jgi:cell fate regulator YaaT (PSP1 superfamily)
MAKYYIAKLDGEERIILFDAGVQDLNNMRKGDWVIVEVEGKSRLAQILNNELGHDCPKHNCYKLIRKVTEEDEQLIKKIKEKEKKAFRYCINRIEIRQLPIKLIKVEFLLDNSKAIFYYSADGRIDFRELVKDLAGRFKLRIEMRQIGIRDQAKLIGGIGPCGRLLCCCSFIRKFEPVSIKIAKEQGLGFNINKVSGFCGRLMCCLQFEADYYKSEAAGEMIELNDSNYIEEDMG